jgi:hypothetical protein
LAVSDDAPLLEFTSHIEGKNAQVSIWSDRIEWTRESGKVAAAGRWSAATVTLGASLLKTGTKGRKDHNVIPIKMIQGVTTKRAGLRYTAVVVMTGADSVEFHVNSSQAEEAKSTITRLMLEGPSAAPAPAPAPAPVVAPESDPADQLRKLSELHQSGLLTDEEFASKRAVVLDKL